MLSMDGRLLSRLLGYFVQPEECNSRFDIWNVESFVQQNNNEAKYLIEVISNFWYFWCIDGYAISVVQNTDAGTCG